jgi:hypothetical protein
MSNLVSSTSVEELCANNVSSLEEQLAMLRPQLADLDAKRVTLAQTITSLQETVANYRKLLGIGNGNGASASIKIPRNFFAGMSVIEAVKKYLRLVKMSQTNREIVEALKDGGFEAKSNRFVDTVRTLLTRNAEQRGDLVWKDKKWELAEWQDEVPIEANDDFKG